MRNFQTGNITHLQKTDASWNQWHMGGVFSVYEITICYVESTFPKLGNAAQIDKERYFESTSHENCFSTRKWKEILISQRRYMKLKWSQESSESC